MTSTRKEEEVGMGKLATEVCESEQGSELTKKGFRGDCSVFKLLSMQV